MRSEDVFVLGVIWTGMGMGMGMGGDHVLVQEALLLQRFA